MKKCDLHIHSNISDGRLTPEEIVEIAVKKGLSAISITDHDAVDAIDIAKKAIGDRNIELVPGIEFSANFSGSNGIEEIHVLGYYLNYKSKILKEVLDEMASSRLNRAIKIVENLKNIGIDIPYSEVIAASGNKITGRPHIADVMVAHGYVPDRMEAFKKYLIKGKPGYCGRYKLEFSEIVKLIKSMGGIPVLAHPGIIENQSDIGPLIEQGIMGLEVYHGKNSTSDIHKLIQIAQARNLLITGGSDCHGPSKGHPLVLGSITVEYKYLLQLKAAAIKMEGNIK